MIKDIVVNLGLGDYDPAGDFAISVAAAFEAHVLGVAFSYEPIIPGSVMGGIPPEFIESQRAESDKKARKAVARFEQAVARAGVSAESRILSASISGAADQLGRLGRRFDLVVVGQAGGDKSAADEVVDEGVLFDSGRPVIFVPYIQKAGLKLDRVMLCWDGSRAAARAIADSMPFLHKAKQMEIVMVSAKPGKTDGVAGVDLGQHLARHGLQVNVKRITSPDLDITSTILSHAADSSADMIVMGGYGHSRLREFILGGVTRGILKTMTVPALMSH
ncbi:MAG: universal stress protein [Deltaproteobacteria bacterium]|nr:universal stress protein [Deltaproteobacteria bacterium]